MKLNSRLLSGGLALAAVLATSACTDLLNETPRATYTPDYFKTTRGVEMGISGLYENLRSLHGDYYYTFTQMATDETASGQLADGNQNNIDLTIGRGSLFTADNDPGGRAWNNGTFATINDANGIIENGTAAGISPSLLAEANFFRAYRYFLLVTTFGGAPLDLGSGELKFNNTPTTASTRNTVPEVYTKVIFPDLLYCIANLPDSPRATGTVTKNVARLFLSKAYLTYAWWLENPNDIPTYPETPRNDPDGKTYQQYFQLAYDTALEAINNPGPYGLMPSFFEAHLAANDRNMEMLFYVDHTQNRQYGGFDPNNNATRTFYHFFFTIWQYDTTRSYNDAGNAVQSIWREAVQEYGRPWARQAPPIGVLTNTFADKEHDSRFESTFVTTLFANWQKNGSTASIASLTNANGMTVRPGDPIVKFLHKDEAPGVVTYPADGQAGKSNVGAGEMAGEAAWVVEPTKINRHLYPAIWKHGQLRTDHPSNQLGGFNGSSPRPQKLAMFSELYLIAAEAYVKGATGSMTARDLVNVIRARAGKWVHKNSESLYAVTGPNHSADHSADMVAATPAVIDIDYILMERSREYYGEGYRWYDLTRTQKWEEYGATYLLADKDRHDAKANTREILKQYYLRPIPLGQLDAMVGLSEAEKAAYQNPGYYQPK
ncbi:MAG: RagB/SusD family nutrient uptake outer membrane protein [Alistipes sp.]|jgi:hypothetical protein|nr:RagB/SusD family nutrient uptake outer membrane protein [Alistipes sp.]